MKLVKKLCANVPECVISLAHDYRERNQEVIAGGENVVVNPIDAFLLIRRLTGDWSYAEQLMRHNSADGFLKNISMERDASPVRFPEADDFEGAAIAILRLQDVYKLDTHDMAEGKIQNTEQGQKMDALDCFSIGQVAYRKQDYYHTLMWMQEALDRVQTEDPQTADIGEILEHLAFALFQQGNSSEVAKDLYCYFKRDRPYLKFAPIKVEVMNWKPKIMFFRQVLSDYEIATLKQLALPLLRRATVHNAETGDLETASYRVSKKYVFLIL
ncbi:unnamed protein product [Soboliphyme baturini]|uniref:P4Ha_N domain-containing protein n=1 Tax=Soboliphyme baturini TaxID=241478 RepID=A0A183IPH7_9BILA|nr:unnamed protein product [Soboliphyme baturini]